jgi:aquaporin Z
MATKKAASNAKRVSSKAAPSKKPTTTKVTTVKAVESRPTRSASARRLTFVSRFNRASLLPAAIAEFVGTFLLATVAVTQQNQPIALLFALLGIVLVVGGVSGAHLNPIATVGAWVTGKIRSPRAIAYLVAQVLGAMLALVVLNAFIGQAAEVTRQAAQMGQSTPTLFKAAAIPAGKEWTLLLAELLGTVILGLAYASALRVVRDKVAASLTIGAGYFLALVIAGTVATYVSASVILNPATAISLQALNFSSVWPVAVYVVTSLVGGVLGFALYDLLAANTAEDVVV